MPKVSVIIPTYNRAAAAAEAIASVLNQTLGGLEVIVVDDGSTDGTREAVAAIPDSRIRYFYKSNSGPAGARNFGLQRAGGDFIAFLDHDDLWPADYLEIMIAALNQHPGYGLVYCPITVTYPDGRREKTYKIQACKSGWVVRDLFKTGFVWTSAAVMRREILKDFYYDESLSRSYEDGDFFLRLSIRTPFLFIRDVEAIKRVHSANFSAVVGVQPTRILVLERFYYQLGGDKVVPKRIALRRLSRACRSVAKANYRAKNRRAALTLCKKAIQYNPYDLRLYCDFFRIVFLKKEKDNALGWVLPEPLSRMKYPNAIEK